MFVLHMWFAYFLFSQKSISTEHKLCVEVCSRSHVSVTKMLSQLPNNHTNANRKKHSHSEWVWWNYVVTMTHRPTSCICCDIWCVFPCDVVPNKFPHAKKTTCRKNTKIEPPNYYFIQLCSIGKGKICMNCELFQGKNVSVYGLWASAIIWERPLDCCQQN